MLNPAGGAGASAPRLVTDPAHGGRWTSLVSGGREWLWRRADPARERVVPGDAFVDAGGVEECVPTVRGVPDHGDAWSRPWERRAGAESVECPGFRLARRVETAPTATTVHYRLTARPGFRFVWAAHALLDLSDEAGAELPAGAPLRFYPDATDRWEQASWPSAGGARLDRFGPADGTAVGAVAAAPEVTVRDGRDSLRMRLDTYADTIPVSIAVWRNLGGFPEGAPYRSIGVEPMLGRSFALAGAKDADVARVPPSGEIRWRLTLTAFHL
ncbi:hypothetical protein [Streptomyces sp. NPDC050560]|uniref:hypothetical protein n=1 Tax=Streptomyces sp. NPDC050560 TaxID=3365630 RepID=UPI00379BF586